MENYSKIYDWKKDIHANASSSRATLAWDSVQRLFCCGLNGPEDWDTLRPKQVPSHFYPGSCCVFKTGANSTYPGLCKKSSPLLYKTGCLEQIKYLEDVNILVHSLFIVLLLILSVFSAILNFRIKYCSSKKYKEQRNSVASLASINSNQRTFPPQPAFNEAYLADEQC